ncbi:MAG TPA: alcohol dehydrogenase catalytic domain-containing protein [Acidobacteriaceae bacterium]|nr:alcohol dehydrogenase catalytic domain-containing protein [Acidobacteriaceae bacterium]
MATTATAIITEGAGTFILDEVIVSDPQDGEILVEIKASGICHTDIDSMSWGRTIIMGHEGAGIVRACGTGVHHVKPGDAVLLNWAIPCGNCFQCRAGAENICENKPVVPDERVRYKGRPIGRAFQLGTMATHAIVPWQAVVGLNREMPFPSAAILGCGVMTGFGSVVNAARVQRGSCVVVLGAGGVGLSVIQGALYVCASTIIAVDLNPRRLDVAISLGATHTILASKDDIGLLRVAAQIREMTGRGSDYAFECTAVPELASAPLAMVRNGGCAVAVSGVETVVPVNMELFEWDKRYINPLYGQCRPFTDFPALLALYSRGQLKLDEMVTHIYPLSELAEALDHMKRGINSKGVLVP